MLQSSGVEKAHHEYMTEVGHKSAQGIVKVACNKAKQYIPATLKLYWAKKLSQLLYDTPLSPPSPTDASFKLVQSNLLKSLFQLPNCVSQHEVYVWNLALLKQRPGYLLPPSIYSLN